MYPRLPPPSAGSDDVRSYIAQILISKQTLTPSQASETANLWLLGRGSELRDTSLRVFKGIFGDYTGWVIFRMVHEDELLDWKESRAGMASRYALLGAVVFSIFLILRIMGMYVFKSPSKTLPRKQNHVKKVILPIGLATLLVGLLLLNYGTLTPSSNSGPIVVGGLMLSLPAGFVVVISLINIKNT